LVYDGGGHMSVQLMDRRRKSFASEDRMAGTPEHVGLRARLGKGELKGWRGPSTWETIGGPERRTMLSDYLKGEDPRQLLEKKMRDEGRLPPGQSATIKWPVLHVGAEPVFDADLDRDDVLLAMRRNGTDIEGEHGGPLRLMVPHLYAWKSCKWIRGLIFMEDDKSGYWERLGYHRRGDPFQEERFS
jgi:hypothetical protein